MAHQTKVRLLFLTTLAAIFGFGAGCTKKDTRPTIWIYTGLYPYIVQDLNTRLQRKFPDIQFKWYQSGSENVSAKIEAEALAGRTQADIIIAGDLFWYQKLKERGLLLKYDSPITKNIPLPYRDPDGTWACNRFAVMVMAYNSDAYSEATAPKGFQDLTNPRFKDKFSMGSPLESGSNFTTVALLSKKFGWGFYRDLRANGAVAAGGSASVISRIETKERPVGIVLLENVLTIRKKNPKIVAIYPKEGPIAEPGAVGISAKTDHPELAKQVYDFFFSKDAGQAGLAADYYSIWPDMPAPGGAWPIQKILKDSIPWTLEFMTSMKDERENIKKTFSKIMYE